MYVDPSHDYTLNCLTSDRHADSEYDVKCTGWIAPLNVVRECQCACHERVPRPSYYAARDTTKKYRRDSRIL